MAAVTRETPAIVLESRNHGESDKIVTFYTFDRGKVSGIAKGASKSKKRFLNKLEQFSYITLFYTEKQHTRLLFITETDLISSFMKLRIDTERYICGCFIIETLLIATVELESDAKLFALLHWCLQALEGDKNHLTVCTIFLVRLFDRLGYCPDFSYCRTCENDFTTTDTYYFNHMAGGLVCKICHGSTAASSDAISLGTIRILQSVLHEPLERLHRLHFSRQALRESLKLLHRYGRTLFQRELQSWKAIRPLI